jgi:YbgA-like uncharacterized protein
VNRTSSKPVNRRLERKMIEAMIALYCRDHHGHSLCAECGGLAAYARQRLEKCPFGDQKPTCAKCPIHCYKADRRAQVQTVMRYAGPRMLWRRPLLAIRHLLHERQPAPERPRHAESGRVSPGS